MSHLFLDSPHTSLKAMKKFDPTPSNNKHSPTHQKDFYQWRRMCSEVLRLIETVRSVRKDIRKTGQSVMIAIRTPLHREMTMTFGAWDEFIYDSKIALSSNSLESEEEEEKEDANFAAHDDTFSIIVTYSHNPLLSHSAKHKGIVCH